MKGLLTVFALTLLSSANAQHKKDIYHTQVGCMSCHQAENMQDHHASRQSKKAKLAVKKKNINVL